MLLVKRLIWDEWNIKHIARHKVLPNEVEEICNENSQTEEAKKERIKVTGFTPAGRLISAFLDPEPEEGVYYPVTARDANKKERISYELWCKGGE